MGLATRLTATTSVTRFRWSPSENEFSRQHLDRQAPAVRLGPGRSPSRYPSEVFRSLHPIPHQPPGHPRRPRVLGSLFESLVIQSLQVHAEVLSARVFHPAPKAGSREVDIILEGADRRVVA